MTLAQRYADLSQPLTMFGKTYQPVIKELSIEELQAYANRCIASGIPMLKSVGFEMNNNIWKAGCNLNGSI